MKRIKLLMSVIMLMSASAAMAVFNPTNLAYNPDFEMGDTTDWFFGGSALISIISDNGPSMPGSFCIQISTPGSKDLRSQGVPVTPGKEYQLTFDYKTSAGASNNPQVRFRFWDNLGEGGTYGNFKGEAQRTLDLTNGEWATVEPMQMIAPEGAVAVDIVFSVNVFGSFSGDVEFDNIEVLQELEIGKAVNVSPEPGQSGILSTALLEWKAPRDPVNSDAADPETHSFVVYCDPNQLLLESADFYNHEGIVYFSNQLFTGDIAEDPIQTLDLDPDLLENTTYYWRVDTRFADYSDPNEVSEGIILSFNTNIAPKNVVAHSSIVMPGEADGVVNVTADDPAGTGLSYKWYLDPDPTVEDDEVALSDGADYSGTSTSDLIVVTPEPGYTSEGGDEGYYLCDVTNASGTTRSNSARLVIGRLVNHYELDDSLADSVSGYDGVIPGNGTAPEWPVGKIGSNAIELFGNEGLIVDLGQPKDGYPSGTYPNSGQQITVTAWVQARVIPNGWRTIAGNWGNGLFKLAVNPEGQLNFEISQPGGSLFTTDPDTFPDTADQWQFVAAVADGNYVRLYRMGADEAVSSRNFQVASSEYNGSLKLDNLYAGIGCYSDDGQAAQFAWNGKIDDVRIYNYGMSAEEVAGIYGSSVCLYSSTPDNPRYLNLALDINNDCMVDISDFAELANSWLENGIYTP